MKNEKRKLKIYLKNIKKKIKSLVELNKTIKTITGIYIIVEYNLYTDKKKYKTTMFWNIKKL